MLKSASTGDADAYEITKISRDECFHPWDGSQHLIDQRYAGYGSRTTSPLQAVGQMIKSFVLIIGSMKSGTTTLFDALSRHPEIAPCTPKEPGFFAFEEVWAQGFDWYEKLFPYDPQVHRFALDGSTDYTKRPFCDGVADRLAASAPRDFHLIYIMRDPIRRIESHARHTQVTKREVGRFPSPRVDHSFDSGISPVNLATSRYASQLEPYRPFVDQGKLHLMSLELLKSDYKAEMSRVLDFLGLKHHEAVLSELHSNHFKYKRQPTRISGRVRHSRYLNFLPPRFRHTLSRPFERNLDLPGRFVLTEEERAILTLEIGPEVEELHQSYDFVAPAEWGFAKAPTCE